MSDHDEPEAEASAAAAPSRALVPVQRHDGFTPKRRRKFLKALRKTGCVQDACRKSGISDSAAYKARRRDPEFRALWAAALSKAGGDIETLAWHIAVDGVEEPIFAYGKYVGTRRKRDPHLFRMLLQASNPARYGGLGYGSRKALEKKIRAEMEEEQLTAPDGIEDVRRRILRKLAIVRKRQLATGDYFEDEEGQVIPRGYAKIEAAPGGRPVSEPDPSSGGAREPEGGADWTESEPPSGAGGGEEEAEKSPFPEERRLSWPRIRPLGDW